MRPQLRHCAIPGGLPATPAMPSLALARSALSAPAVPGGAAPGDVFRVRSAHRLPGSPPQAADARKGSPSLDTPHRHRFARAPRAMKNNRPRPSTRWNTSNSHPLPLSHAIAPRPGLNGRPGATPRLRNDTPPAPHQTQTAKLTFELCVPPAITRPTRSAQLAALTGPARFALKP